MGDEEQDSTKNNSLNDIELEVEAESPLGNSAQTEIVQLGNDKIIKNQIDNLKIFTIEVIEGDTGNESKKYGVVSKVKVGRSAGVEGINLSHASVSSVHCMFAVKDEKLYIVDRGSRNGTYLAGEKLKSGEAYHIQENDSILVGSVELKIGKMRAFDLLKHNVEIADEPRLKEFLKEHYNQSLPLTQRIMANSSNTFVLKLFRFIKNIISLGSRNKNEGENGYKKIASPPAVEIEKKFSKNRNRTEKKIFERGMFMARRIYLVPGPFLRLWSFLGDLALSSALHLYCYRQFAMYRGFIDDTWNMTLVWWPKIPFAKIPHAEEVIAYISNYLSFEIIQTTFPLIVAYILFAMFSTLILGVTFCQRLMGIKSWSDGLWCRFGGLIRIIIGFITAPFIIFDLPCLFNTRTFKEIITFTYLESENGKFGKLVPSVLCLLIISVSLFVHKMECLGKNDQACDINNEITIAMTRSPEQWIQFLDVKGGSEIPIGEVMSETVQAKIEEKVQALKMKKGMMKGKGMGKDVGENREQELDQAVDGNSLKNAER